MSDLMELVEVPASTVAVSRTHVAAPAAATLGEQVGGGIATMAARLEDAHVAIVGPPMARYRMVGDGFDIEVGFPVDPGQSTPADLDLVVVGGCTAAHLTHVGPYTELPEAYAELQRQAADTGHPVDDRGLMWEEYWSAPGTPDNETRTEIYWSLPDGPAGADEGASQGAR